MRAGDQKGQSLREVLRGQQGPGGYRAGSTASPAHCGPAPLRCRGQGLHPTTVMVTALLPRTRHTSPTRSTCAASRSAGAGHSIRPSERHRPGGCQDREHPRMPPFKPRATRGRSGSSRQGGRRPAGLSERGALRSPCPAGPNHRVPLVWTGPAAPHPACLPAETPGPERQEGHGHSLPGQCQHRGRGPGAAGCGAGKQRRARDVSPGRSVHRIH